MKFAIIVPYRNRPHHLAQFVRSITKYCPDALLVIVEQVDELPFNRGKLLNVGFLEAGKQTGTYCVFHDVDKLPVLVDYSFPNHPTQLASSTIQVMGYFGGVTAFNNDDFWVIGGYHNEFYCRAEDNEMFFRVKGMDRKIIYRIGQFEDIPHPRTGVEFDPVLWERAQKPRKAYEGLGDCRYKVVERSEGHGIIYLKVDLIGPKH